MRAFPSTPVRPSISPICRHFLAGFLLHQGLVAQRLVRADPADGNTARGQSGPISCLVEPASAAPGGERLWDVFVAAPLVARHRLFVNLLPAVRVDPIVPVPEDVSVWIDTFHSKANTLS